MSVHSKEARPNSSSIDEKYITLISVKCAADENYITTFLTELKNNIPDDNYILPHFILFLSTGHEMKFGPKPGRVLNFAHFSELAHFYNSGLRKHPCANYVTSCGKCTPLNVPAKLGNNGKIK